MPQQQGQQHTKSRLSVKEPSRYDVVMLNDDFTTMEFVVEMLTQVFFHSEASAEAIMLRIHREGSAVVGTYTFDTATSKAAKVHERARKEGFPLRVEVKERK